MTCPRPGNIPGAVGKGDQIAVFPARAAGAPPSPQAVRAGSFLRRHNVKWPLRIYEFSYAGRLYRVGESQLLARDSARSGPGRFLYRAPAGYFMLDMAYDPPLVTAGPGFDPDMAYGALAVEYLPRRVAIPPGSWQDTPEEVKTFPLEMAAEYPLPRRGLDPWAFPQPETEPPAEEDLLAVVGGLRYRVRGSRLLARGPLGNLYRTGGGHYFATIWRGGRPFIEVLGPLSARELYLSWRPVVPPELAFTPGDWADIEPDEGWRVPALQLQPPPPGLLDRLPDIVAYGQALRPRDGHLLAWGLSRLGSGELVAELLLETAIGEFVELIWAGGGDYRVLEWPPELVRYPYERLPYKAVPPAETVFEAPGFEA